ncbi:MAG: hypothetical protein GY940_10060 [bacterium]|nr:hypothetical protein [bacterium]
MGNILPFLNDDIDPEQSKQVITSHRNFLGKPILYLKHKFLNMFQFYTSFLLNKQRSFNDKLVAYQLSSFIRFRQNEKHIKAIEEKLKEIEENQELLMDQLKNLTNNNNTKKKGNG